MAKDNKNIKTALPQLFEAIFNPSAEDIDRMRDEYMEQLLQDSEDRVLRMNKRNFKRPNSF